MGSEVGSGLLGPAVGAGTSSSEENLNLTCLSALRCSLLPGGPALIPALSPALWSTPWSLFRSSTAATRRRRAGRMGRGSRHRLVQTGLAGGGGAHTRSSIGSHSSTWTRGLNTVHNITTLRFQYILTFSSTGRSFTLPVWQGSHTCSRCRGCNSNSAYLVLQPERLARQLRVQAVRAVGGQPGLVSATQCSPVLFSTCSWPGRRWVPFPSPDSRSSVSPPRATPP